MLSGSVLKKDEFKENWEILEKILKSYPELREGKAGLYYITGLQVAAALAKSGVPPILEELVREGDINQGDELGRTPLHYATLNGNLEVMEFLLESGANPECAFRFSPSNYKVPHYDDFDRWNKLYTMLPPPDSPDSWGRTPLHVAAKKGNVSAVKLLIEYGAKVNVDDDKGVTPLLLAGCNRNKALYEETVEFLVENGADVHRICRVTGTTALFYAVILDSIKATEILLKAGAWITPTAWQETELHKAAANGSSEIIKRLLEDPRISVEDVNRADEYNRTPAYRAAYGGHRECLRMLIDHGASIGHRMSSDSRSVLDVIFDNIARPGEFMRELFDARIKSNKLKPTNECYNITLDFRLLAPFEHRKQMQVIANILLAARKQDRYDILQHPYVESFLRIKWAHIRQFFFLLIYIYVTFVASLSIYVIVLLYDNGTLGTIATICRYFLMFTSGGLFVHGIIQAVLLPRIVLRQYELQINIGCTMMCLYVSVAYDFHNRSLHPWVLHTTSITILIAWIQLMLLIGRFPTLGYYSLMFSAVLQNALKVLLTFVCLVIGFSLSFTVQFQLNAPFENPLYAVTKTIVMMMGEYEYLDLFSNGEFKGLNVTSRFIFMVFIVLASLVLMNLMVGLAVSDIQALEQEGHVRRLEKQAEFLRQLEMVISLKLIDSIWMPSFVRNFLKRKRSISTTLIIQPENLGGAGVKSRWHKNLPPELVDAIKEVAARNNGDDEDEYMKHSDIPRLIRTLKQLIQNCERRSSIVSNYT